MMRSITLAMVGLAALVGAGSAGADQYVSPYVRSDGTVVQGHMRSSPDSTRFNNYSTRGNTNPYTGQPGYKNPYAGSGGLYGTPQRQRSLFDPYRND